MALLMNIVDASHQGDTQAHGRHHAMFSPDTDAILSWPSFNALMTAKLRA